MLTTSDLQQIEQHGISREKIDWQLSVFKKGPSFIKLYREATPGDGIQVVNNKEAERLIRIYDEQKDISRMKFVPASGAATRMFKALFDYIEAAGSGKNEMSSPVEIFFSRIHEFAFYNELNSMLESKRLDIRQLIRDKKYTQVIQELLLADRMGYGSLPKGLLKFHRYDAKARTPFEEHLAEAALYASLPGQPVKLHFTVSPEHMAGFIKLMEASVGELEKQYGVRYEISFSVQQPSTDTIAVDMQNIPFRHSDGSVLFRPGGHGALIDNLNSLDADLIFIKNIDNVVPERLIQPTVRYKKMLAGKLIELQQQVFSMLHELDSGALSSSKISDMFGFIKKELCYEPKNTEKNSILQLKKILNRPIRVCGVVKNLGEPGGGPFWAPNSMGDISLQIIESSQVNQEDKNQTDIFQRATHFNPVDLVCGPKSYTGTKFNLNEYIDRNTCFISYKSKDGRELKALELPGLWNGAMADWLTLFVEVPVETFNPVKTVNDLLRPQHQ